MKAQATSLDVARLAGVSQSAVSRCFTVGASVSEVMRDKVQEAARKLGYQPNAHARSLITGRSRIIGLVLSALENLYYPAVLERLAKRLQQDGYHLLIFISDNANSDDLVEEILQYNVDGIVLGATTLSSALAQRCADASIPVVLFNRIMASGSAGAVSSVRSDNMSGGRDIARFLVAGGHQRIAYIAGREDSSTNLERERGFREGLAELGQRIYARAIGNYDVAQARQAARDLFAHKVDRPDAVFVAGDQMAIAVLDTLRHELGLSVPQDVSVVGFDNVPQASWASYELTTFEQPVEPMVEATVALLQGYLRESHTPPSRNVVVPGQLIIRQSARLNAPRSQQK
ncbi:MAG: LacI family DNA-binding transcriptional regulator [Rhodoferax sp.]|nr:LacI family DNA-binding transcriptional regulator [Rhodoferax sp.]